MPTRQKLLLIILVVILGYAVYEYVIKGDNTAAPGGDFTAGVPVQNIPQPTGAPQQIPSQSGAVPQAGTQTQQSRVSGIEFIVGKDPFFRVIERKETGAVPPLDSPIAHLKFNGVAVGGKYAVINDRVYKVGETVDNFKIIEIRSDYVILQSYAGVKYTLRRGGFYE